MQRRMLQRCLAKLPHLLVLLVAIQSLQRVAAWSLAQNQRAIPISGRDRSVAEKIRIFRTVLLAVSGADIEQPPLQRLDKDNNKVDENVPPKSDIPTVPGATSIRGKVNEIDFCIAPADVSLSRAYKSAEEALNSSPLSTTGRDADSLVGLSLTRALNNASNRAVRRILLARCWPSAAALNQSLRQVVAQQQAAASAPASTKQRSRTDAEYVADQLQSFSVTYGSLPGYSYAQDYLDCVLSLATSGIESATTANAVLKDGVYREAYQRILSVLRTVGVEFIVDEATKARCVAPKLKDKDICLSMLDKIQMRREAGESLTVASLASGINSDESKNVNESNDSKSSNDTPGRFRFKFWKRNKAAPVSNIETQKAILLPAEPTMTRQLNFLSNIVQRALLFGGDQELLVLARTLEADLPIFEERWYASVEETKKLDQRPGVNYFQCLILLLHKCYENGVVTDLDPPVQLSSSYANSYERLVTSAVELGSGYLKPPISSGSPESNVALVTSMPKPRTAQEELGRFAVWESNFRQQSAAATASSSSSSPTPSASAPYSLYPLDLVGSWDVRDEIVGETIGRSKVVFLENGDVQVARPLEGLRWRLDPGPTHLDTCTFQVLSTLDETVLQYRGFIDRGARLEARFSKRPIRIRGSVMFQMRDGASVDYYKDMLPINYKTGTTTFVMTKTGP